MSERLRTLGRAIGAVGALMEAQRHDEVLRDALAGGLKKRAPGAWLMTLYVQLLAAEAELKGRRK